MLDLYNVYVRQVFDLLGGEVVGHGEHGVALLHAQAALGQLVEILELLLDALAQAQLVRLAALLNKKDRLSLLGDQLLLLLLLLKIDY